MSSAAISALSVGAGATPSRRRPRPRPPTPAQSANVVRRRADATRRSAPKRNGDNANVAVNGMLDKSVDVHDAMIALQRAEMSLQLAVQIRNKLVQAYQDIMRMPV